MTSKEPDQGAGNADCGASPRVNVLDSTSDSPLARENLQTAFEELSRRSVRARRVMKSLRDVVESSTSFSRDFTGFLQELSDFSAAEAAAGGRGGDAEKELAKCLSESLRALTEMEERRLHLLDSAGKVFGEPLEEIARGPTAPLKEAFRAWTRACDHADGAASRHAATRSGKKAAAETEQEMSDARRQQTLAALELSVGVNSARESQRVAVIEQTFQFVHGHKLWLHESYEAFQLLRGSEHHDRFQIAVSREREEYEKRCAGDEVARRRVLEAVGDGKAKDDPSPGSSPVRVIVRPPLQQSSSSLSLSSSAATSTAAGATQAAGTVASSRPSEVSGWLFRRAGQKWKREWFMIRLGRLYKGKSAAELQSSQALDLMLTSARVRRDIGRDNCFELLSPDKQLVLQAESPERLSEWMSVIERARADRLARHSIVSKAGHTTSAAAASSGGGTASTRKRASNKANFLEALWAISPANRKCADCNEPNPEWASINLGVLLCIQCSGVHRGLGVQLSKVRSIVLDNVESEVMLIISRLGNERVNAILEAKIPQTVTQSYRTTERAAWIKSKYEQRAFIEKSELNKDQHSAKLREACSKDDLPAMLFHLIHGASIDSAPAPEFLSPLHIAVKGNMPLAVAFLLLNNADFDSRDARSWTPIHYAAENDFSDIVAMLLLANANPAIKDGHGLTPADVAQKRESSNCCGILSMAIKAKNDDSSTTKLAFTEALRTFSGQSKATLCGQQGLLAEIASQGKFVPAQPPGGPAAVMQKTIRSRKSLLIENLLLAPSASGPILQSSASSAEQKRTKAGRPLPQPPRAKTVFFPTKK